MKTEILTDIDFATLHQGFLKAFSDYLIPMQPTQEQLQEMITRRGGNLSLSVGVFAGNELVGFTINSLDEYNGHRAFYDLASGVAPDHRRQGIAASLMQMSVQIAREQGASQYILEVFEQNARAVRLYEKIGFRRQRKLEVFRGHTNLPVDPCAFQIREIEPDWKAFESIWDWPPSWQNSIASLQRSKAPQKILGVFQNSTRVGYGIFFPDTGDVAQFCIHPDFRKQGAGTLLFHSFRNSTDADKPLRVVNVDSSATETCSFLSKLLEHFGTQLEMKMDLQP